MGELHCLKYDFYLIHKWSLPRFSLEDSHPIGSLTVVKVLNFFAFQLPHLWDEVLRWLARFVLAVTRYASMKWKVSIFGFGSFSQRTNIKKTQLIFMPLWVSIYSMEYIIGINYFLSAAWSRHSVKITSIAFNFGTKLRIH